MKRIKLSVMAMLAAAFFFAFASGYGVHASGVEHANPQFSLLISDGIQLVRQRHEPAACVRGLDGKIAMTARVELCLCDGETRHWKTVGPGTACNW